MTALTEPTVRVPKHVQTRAEAQAVYDQVTEQDKTCRAPAVDPRCYGSCGGKFERHHAGNTIGSARITDRQHVILLCSRHHDKWAPTHSRAILKWLADHYPEGSKE
jgi:hypothetical protein